MKNDLRKFLIDTFLFGKDTVNLGDDDSLLEKGIIDSTGVLELLAFLQRTYGIEISDGDLTVENLDSVTNLSTFVTNRLALVKGQSACR